MSLLVLGLQNIFQNFQLKCFAWKFWFPVTDVSIHTLLLHVWLHKQGPQFIIMHIVGMCSAYPAIEVAFVIKIKSRTCCAGSLFRLWNLPFCHWYSSNWDVSCKYFAHLELRIVQAESKMDSCSRHNGANWNSSRFVISLCGSARICYFSSQICSDLLFLAPLCPTVLFQPTWVKWWNTEVVVIQKQMW